MKRWWLPNLWQTRICMDEWANCIENSVWSRSRECVKNATSVVSSSISQLAEICFWQYKVSTIFQVSLNLPNTVYQATSFLWSMRCMLYDYKGSRTRGVMTQGHVAGTCRRGMLQRQNHALFTHRGHVCVYAMWLCRYYLCPSYMSLLHVTYMWKHTILSLQHVAGTSAFVMTPRVREA